MVTARVLGERLGERYQQFLLIALGESILTIGITFSGGPGFTRDRTIAFALAMLTTVQLWRIYFYRAGGLLPLAITRAREPVRLGRSASFTHLAMVAGIIVSGVGYELYIDHPLGHTEPGWLSVIIGGPALFLAGRVAFEYQVFGRISRARVAGLLCLGLLIPALLVLPALAAGAATVAVLFAITVADAYRARGRTSEEPAPPV